MKHHKQNTDVKQKPKGLPAGRTRGHLSNVLSGMFPHTCRQTVEITNTINMVDVQTELSGWTQTGVEFLAAALS